MSHHKSHCIVGAEFNNKYFDVFCINWPKTNETTPQWTDIPQNLRTTLNPIDYRPVNSSQLAKMEKSIFLTCPCHKVYRVERVEAVGLLVSNYTLKITIFVNMQNLGQFRLSSTHHILFLPNRFSVEYKFSFPILRGFFFCRKIT